VTRNNERDRLTVEKLGTDCLDVRKLHRVGIFRDRWCIWSPLMGWPDVMKFRACRHRIELDIRNRGVPQQIPVTWTRCHFGGVRPWLHCLCGRRVAKLFKGMGGYYCRPCVGNPIYASQGKSTQGRRPFEACKLRLRLGGVASLAAPFPERPRGMHRTTYMWLRYRAEALERGLPRRFKYKSADYPNLIYYYS
jgi:hypothetical protein